MPHAQFGLIQFVQWLQNIVVPVLWILITIAFVAGVYISLTKGNMQLLFLNVAGMFSVLFIWLGRFAFFVVSEVTDNFGNDLSSGIIFSVVFVMGMVILFLWPIRSKTVRNTKRKATTKSTTPH